MKRRLAKLFLLGRDIIVPGGCGMYGDGSGQWLYTLSVVIQLILLWSINSNIAKAFTILYVVHFATIYVFGWYVEDYKIVAISLILINAVLGVIAFCTQWIFTLIVLTTSTELCFCGDEIMDSGFALPFIKTKKHQKGLFIEWIELIQLILYIAFIIVTLMAPFIWWIKLIIILSLTFLHILIDWGEGNCLCVNYVFSDAIDCLRRKK